MKNTFIIIIIFINFKFIFSQENNHFKDFKIKISGFVSYDAWYHTRQYVSARDGLVSLYPKNIELDKNGDDINEDGYLNAVSMKSRIRFDMKEIEILNGKTSAILEGDFTGTENSNANGFRIRHAYVKMFWENKNLEISFGQRYHPFFILEAIPNVMALHTGVPIQLLNRTPQLRITKKYKNFTIMMSAITQRDFKSPGPLKKDEIKYSSEFLQNAKIPNLNLRFHFNFKNTVFGVATDYKILKPRLKTTINDEDFFKTNEKIKSFSFASFFKTKIGKNFTLKTKIIYSQNLFEHLTLGGYAISSIDKKTGKETYTPTNHFNIWTNIVYEKNYRFSIYGGFLKNLGTTDDIIENSIFYARGENIDNLYKITSHISKKINKFQIAFETERTTVSYGKIDFENKGKIKNTKAVTDYRFLFVVMYFF